jgi:hypothetical protein
MLVVEVRVGKPQVHQPGEGAEQLLLVLLQQGKLVLLVEVLLRHLHLIRRHQMQEAVVLLMRLMVYRHFGGAHRALQLDQQDQVVCNLMVHGLVAEAERRAVD